MKYIEISLTKYMQDTYAHIYKTLMREIELDLQKWRDVLHTWIGSQCCQDVISPQIDL